MKEWEPAETLVPFFALFSEKRFTLFVVLVENKMDD